jgi:cellobiose transport system substrate-binding protein
MSVTKRRLRQAAAVAIAAFTALSVTAGCNKSNTPAPGSKPAKLCVDTFGQFGYDDLVKQYQTQTGITIELRKTQQLGDYRNKLVRFLATRKGACDVAALEQGIISEMKLSPNNWVDLSKYVPASLGNNYLKWKWEEGKAADGFLMGLPTDTGSLAMCYRRDLFEAAGIDPDREKVSASWPTWEQFIEVGKTYTNKTHKGFFDSIAGISNAVLFQGSGGDLFYDKDDNLYKPGAEQKPENLIAASNPTVKKAWDTAVAVFNAGISAKTQTWSPAWSAGFKNGAFAVTACPAWMLGIVRDNSGAEHKGQWDVAAVPGGSGNWGGSWLGVPAQTKYPEEAAKLAMFLTNGSSQVAAFKKSGPLPTETTALQDPAFTGYTDAYFNNAPTGKIFGESVKNIQPVHLGPKHAAVKERAFEGGLNALQAGQLSADAAWQQFLNDVPVQGAF